jgi:hypothetical protein
MEGRTDGRIGRYADGWFSARMWTNKTVHNYDSSSYSFINSYKIPSKSKNMLKGTNGSGDGYEYPSCSSCKFLHAARIILRNCCSAVRTHTGLVLQPKRKKCIWWEEMLIADLAGTWHRNEFCVLRSVKGSGNGFHAFSNSRRLYHELTGVDSSVTSSISQVQSYPHTSRTLVFVT